jgi:hypothetical protein
MPAAKNITRIAAALLIGGTGAAFAGPPDWAPAHGYRHKFHGPRVVRVVPAPYVAYPVRPVAVLRVPSAVYGAPVAYAPAPVYYHRARPHYGVPGALAGAVAGAVIGGALGHGDQRVAAIAVGSVVGAVIGHEISGGH